MILSRIVVPNMKLTLRWESQQTEQKVSDNQCRVDCSMTQVAVPETRSRQTDRVLPQQASEASTSRRFLFPAQQFVVPSSALLAFRSLAPVLTSR